MLKEKLTEIARSAERATLAAAIERRESLRRLIVANIAAQDTAFDQMVNAKSVIEKAKGAIETAEAAAATNLANRLMGATGEPPLSVRDAKLALQDAEDELESVQAARKVLEEQERIAQSDLEWTERSVTEKAKDVIRSAEAVAGLIADFETVQRHFVEKKAAVEWLVRNGVVPNEFKSRLSIASNEQQKLSDAPAWVAALEALKVNPDAQLPK